MPLPKGSKVLGQKRSGDKLLLFYKNKGKTKVETRSCKCTMDKSKPCKCKK